MCAPESGDCFPSQPLAASTASLAWEESEAGDGRDRRRSSSRAPLPPAGQQLGGGPLGSPHRPKVDVLLDLPPDRDQQSPQRLHVRDVRHSNRTEEDWVVRRQPLNALPTGFTRPCARQESEPSGGWFNPG